MLYENVRRWEAVWNSQRNHRGCTTLMQEIALRSEWVGDDRRVEGVVRRKRGVVRQGGEGF